LKTKKVRSKTKFRFENFWSKKKLIQKKNRSKKMLVEKKNLGRKNRSMIFFDQKIFDRKKLAENFFGKKKSIICFRVFFRSSKFPISFGWVLHTLHPANAPAHQTIMVPRVCQRWTATWVTSTPWNPVGSTPWSRYCSKSEWHHRWEVLVAPKGHFRRAAVL